MGLTPKNDLCTQIKARLLCYSFWNVNNPLLHIRARFTVSEVNFKIFLWTKRPRGSGNCLNLCRPLGGSAAPSQPWRPQGLWKQQPGLEQPYKILFRRKWKMRNQKPRSSFLPKQRCGSSAPKYLRKHISKSAYNEIITARLVTVRHKT